MVTCKDQECQSTDFDLDGNFCNECGEELEEEAEEKKLIVVGVIREAEPVPKKDKLTKLKVEVGNNGKEVTIVTNAKHCEPEKVVVVALVGAKVPTMEDPVEKAVVGGVKSEGMLCDCPMLGWTGGAAGQAVFLPSSFKAGDQPPDSRPRAS